MKRRLVLALAVVVIAIGVAVTRTWWLALPGEWLDVSDRVEPADVIFMVSGHSLWRAKAAARLYEQHYAPRVVATGGGESDLLLLVTGERIMDTEIIGRILARFGVPSEATTLIGGVTSTGEDAEAFGRYVRSHGVRSAIVVTSHLHSRRARWTFRRVLGDPSVRIQVVEAPQTDLTPSRWWQREEGLVAVFNEYLKLAYYVAKY